MTDRSILDLHKAFSLAFPGSCSVTVAASGWCCHDPLLKRLKGWRAVASSRSSAAGEFTDVTTLAQFSGGWVFDDAEPRYTIGLVTVFGRGEVAGPQVSELRGPYSSSRALYQQHGVKRADLPSSTLMSFRRVV